VHANQFFSLAEFVNHVERACHFVIASIPAGADGVPEVVTRVERIFGSQARKSDRQTRVWLEALAVPREHPVAERRRARELRRPVRPGGALCRIQVLRYADFSADLLVVAHRAELEAAALARLVRSLLGSDPEPYTLPALTESSAAVPVAATEASIEFGMPEHGRTSAYGRVALPGAPQSVPSIAHLIAALSVVLARYTMGSLSRIGVVDELDRTRVVELEIGDDTSVAQTLIAASAALESEHAVTCVPPFGLVIAFSDAVLHLGSVAPVFPFTIEYRADTEGVAALSCAYDEAQMAPQIAADFALALSRAIGAMGARPDAHSILDLELNTPAEMVALSSAGATAPPALESAENETIASRFAAVARRQSEAVACSEEGRQLTYGALHELAGRLAAGLCERGARRGVRIGVCLERGVELVSVLLAVLRTGAAYIPLDPHAPAARLSYTARDAEVALIVTNLGSLAELGDVRLVKPAELSTTEQALQADAPAGAAGSDAAYVIYTSGSTGRPKGVLVPQRNVLALLAATSADFELGPSDVWSQYHSSAFDFSVWEIWGCLLTGGHLVTIPYWTSRSPDEFCALLSERRVTVLSQTPSAFAQLDEADARRLQTDARAERLSVRLLVFGGEPLDVTSLRRWFFRHPHVRCRVVNMYGITETTVHVTSQTITPAQLATRSRSVGRALPGWRVSVRDRRGRPLPFGARGEIYVGGAGVADGYLNQDALTAERFLPDAFAPGTVYRSGDCGRLRPDGQLEHLGRIDNQVKIRGHRIELDEIRAVLLEAPGVSAAAVIVREGRPGDSATARLDAYVACRGNETAEIRAWAASLLPDYMMPSSVTAMAELPIDGNGKVDLRRLPLPSTSPAKTASSTSSAANVAGLDFHVEPMTTLLRIWEGAFERPVKPTDNFFELGGNSLLAVRLLAKHRAAGLPPVSVRELYRAPTISAVAALMASKNG